MIKSYFEKQFVLKKGFVFLFLCILSINTVYSQITVNVSNKPVREILKEIERKSDYKFFYNSDFTALNAVKSINAENLSLDAIMNQLFEETGITWEKETVI